MSSDPYATYATTATNTPQHVAVTLAPDHHHPPAGLQNSVAPSSYYPQQYQQPEVPTRPKAAPMSMDSTAAGSSMGAKQRSAPIFLYVLLILLLVGVVVVIIVMTAFTASSYHQLSDIRTNTQAALVTGSNSSQPSVCNCPTCPSLDLQVLANALGKAAFAQNADSALVRSVAGPPSDSAIPDYDPVHDFNIARSTDQVTPYGYAKAMNVDNFPAAHNQAMAQTLFQLEVGGSNSPHHHPDGVEILFVFQGMIEVTRIEPNGGGKFVNTLHANMTVIFPRGHIHFQRNIGTTVARYISTLNSERPGVMSEAQRICELPYDALLSMFSLKTAQNVYEMCEKVPHNIIQYVTGTYPQPSSSSSSSAAPPAAAQSSSSSHA